MRSLRSPSVFFLMLGLLITSACQAESSIAAPEPEFYFGADLSYVNEMEDCGAVYLENGQPRDPFELFQAHGANLVRTRLWNNPTWTKYSTLDDVKKTFTRAQETGMDTLLDFQYSDNWADPSRQEIPAAWEAIEDEDELAQALYQYTYDVLIELNKQWLMPDFVQIGNEINSGLVKERVGLDWPRDAKLLQAGIRAVRAAAQATETSPRIILHVAQPENTGWWFKEATENGITDFDVIGISYYPQWSSFSISGLASQVNSLRQVYAKDVMVVEAGYPWTLDSAPETASNVLTQGQRGYPISPAGQLNFMQDLSQALINNGALGVVYWEPAWVSTSCSTRWGQGSHWENATFFDFQNNDEVLEGIDYMSFPYSPAADLVDAKVDDAYGQPLAEDVTGDALNGLPELDLVSLHEHHDESSISFALTLAGDAETNPGNNYRVYFDTTEDQAGGALDVGKRPVVVADPYKPEFVLEIRIVEASGTVVAEGTLFSYVNGEWKESAFTGGLAAKVDSQTVIEFQIFRRALGNPEFLNIAVASAGRILNRTLADLIGPDATAAESTETTTVSTFIKIELTSD